MDDPKARKIEGLGPEGEASLLGHVPLLTSADHWIANPFLDPTKSTDSLLSQHVWCRTLFQSDPSLSVVFCPAATGRPMRGDCVSVGRLTQGRWNGSIFPLPRASDAEGIRLR